MNNKKRKISLLISTLVISFLAILVFCINDYGISPFLPILPLLYLICFIVICIKKPIILRSTVALIILGTFFIRIVVVPLLYVSSGYSSKIDVESFDMNSAVFLQAWEFFCVFIMLLLSRRASVIDKEKQKVKDGNSDRIKFFVKVAICLLAITAIVCISMDKGVLTSISTVFNRLFETKGELISRRMTYYETKASSSVILNVFIQAVYYLQILIPAFLLSRLICRKKQESNMRFWLALLVSLTSVIVVTDNNMDSICIMAACLIVLYGVYKEKMKKLLPILGIILIVFVFSLLFVKAGLSTDSGISDISRTLSAYFAALPNIGIAFSLIYVDKISTLFGDVVAGVPYLIILFKGLPQSLYIYNEAIYGYSGVSDQIMPLVSYGYQYIGVFAPLLTVLVYWLAFYFERKSSESDNTFNKVLYTLMFVNLAVGPCVYGLTSIVRRVCLFVPLLLVVYFNKKHKEVIK